MKRIIATFVLCILRCCFGSACSNGSGATKNNDTAGGKTLKAADDFAGADAADDEFLSYEALPDGEHVTYQELIARPGTSDLLTNDDASFDDVAISGTVMEVQSEDIVGVAVPVYIVAAEGSTAQPARVLCTEADPDPMSGPGDTVSCDGMYAGIVEGTPRIIGTVFLEQGAASNAPVIVPDAAPAQQGSGVLFGGVPVEHIIGGDAGNVVALLGDLAEAWGDGATEFHWEYPEYGTEYTNVVIDGNDTVICMGCFDPSLFSLNGITLDGLNWIETSELFNTTEDYGGRGSPGNMDIMWSYDGLEYFGELDLETDMWETISVGFPSDY